MNITRRKFRDSIRAVNNSQFSRRIGIFFRSSLIEEQNMTW